MVKELAHEGKNVYTCEVCGFGYADGDTANDCESYCKAHNQCSIQITKKAIYKPT